MIVFSKDIDKDIPYPAYNDSFLRFYSNSIVNEKQAIINISYPYNLEIPPPPPIILFSFGNSSFLLNLKPFAINILDIGNLNDQNESITELYGKLKGFTDILRVNIIISGDTEESITHDYEFKKSAYEIGANIHVNESQLLTYSTNGIDFNITYFQGFPFSFDIQKLNASIDPLIFINKYTNFVSNPPLIIDTTSPYRMIVDESNGINWYTNRFMPLINTENLIEMRIGDSFLANLRITKHIRSSGVYLKWQNQQGAYNYWLFPMPIIEDIEVSEIGQVSTDEFNDIENLNNPFKSLGFKSNRNISVKDKINKDELPVLRGLLSSGSVQMYTSQQANIGGKFINVNVFGSMPFNMKKRINEISLTIFMPDSQNVTL